MRFSENGYYIEKYVKCANCGLLIYDEGIQVQNGSAVYCSDWCIEWAKLRDSGFKNDQLEQLGKSLQPNSSAIVVEIASEAIDTAKGLLEPLGATLTDED